MNIIESNTPLDEASKLFARLIAIGYKLIAIHVYTDEYGVAIVFRVRLKLSKDDKKILAMHKNSNGIYEPKEPPTFKIEKKPIYSLQAIHNNPLATIFVVEGENVADKLNAFFANHEVTKEYIATTSGGNTSARKADWTPLKNKTCVLFPDNDTAGIKYIEDVTLELKPLNCVLKFIDTSALGLPESGDFVDFIEMNPDYSLYDFINLIISDQQIVNTNDDDSINRVIAINLSDFLLLELPPKEYIIYPIIPKSGLAMIYAYRGVGKTFFALEILMAIAYGDSFLNLEVPVPRKVLYIDGEMPAISIQERLASIEKRKKSNAKMIEPIIITPDLQNDLMPNISDIEGQQQIEEYVNQSDLIIVDNISTLCGFGKENESESWLPIQQWALGVRKRGKSVLFIHHAGKNGNQRGTSKREDILDTVVKLRHPTDYEPTMGACFELHYEKSRGVLGEDVAPLKCTLNESGWAHELLEVSSYQEVLQYLKNGWKQFQIEKETGLSKGYISKLAKKAKEQGDL